MNKTLSTILIVFAILALAGGIFFFGTLYSRNNNNAYGPGMMNRGSGYGWNNGTSSNVAPLTVDQAKQSAQKYIQSLNIQGLEISEVMIFNNNAYVAVKESDTGLGAFELLVDPASQVAYPEYGPNMMWNLKYGGMNHGEMTLAPGAHLPWAQVPGSAGVGALNQQSATPATVSADMPVAKDQAIKNAQAYLDQNQPGTIVANDPMQFHGYYTLDFSKEGKVAGMLSVNGYNGQVFLHTWHGTFIEESK